ncbi:MAG TPA: hypothetical protein VGL63_13125, partial [Streptosporangiaceae bacterium]
MSEPRRRAAPPGRAYDRGPGSRSGAPFGAGLRSGRRPPSGPARRVWGTLPGRTGVCIVIGSA